MEVRSRSCRLPGDPLQRHATGEIQRDAGEIHTGTWSGTPDTRSFTELTPNLVSLRIVGVRVCVRVTTPFCGTTVWLYWLKVEF